MVQIHSCQTRQRKKSIQFSGASAASNRIPYIFTHMCVIKQYHFSCTLKTTRHFEDFEVTLHEGDTNRPFSIVSRFALFVRFTFSAYVYFFRNIFTRICMRYPLFTSASRLFRLRSSLFAKVLLFPGGRLGTTWSAKSQRSSGSASRCECFTLRRCHNWWSELEYLPSPGIRHLGPAAAVLAFIRYPSPTTTTTNRTNHIIHKITKKQKLVPKST